MKVAFTVTSSLLCAVLAACGGSNDAVAATTTTTSSSFNPAYTSVQMFHWKWTDIAKECTDFLGPNGYGAVQISPPQASKIAGAWWDMFQPVNYGSLTSRMGNESDLQTMVSTCHAAGVRVYADIVVNQLSQDSSSAYSATDGSSWNASTLTYPQFSTNDFHSLCQIQSSDYGTPGNRNNVMFCRLNNLPDLATESTYVQGVIATYMKKLLSLGVDGFRIDAAKHQQPDALNTILNTVKSSYPTTLAGESLWVTQEVIPDGNVVRSDYFQNGTLNEFQFTYAIRDTFRNNNGLNLASLPTVMGSPGNWGGTWGFVQPANAVVFVDNWDTERSGTDSLNASNYTGATNDASGTKRFDLANIFMLAWPYASQVQVMSGYRFTTTDQDAPTASPYDSSGNAQINVNWDFVHRWGDIANMVKFRTATNGQGVSNWTTGNGNQIAFSRGAVGFVALNNDTNAWTQSFQTGLPAGTYCNVVHGLATSTGCASDSVTVDGNGYATITLPANGGSTVPAVAIYTGQKSGSGGSSGGGSGSGTCAVTFTIANANTVFGQNLYVVGNQTALGNWTPASGFALTIQGSGANVPWTGTVSLPAGTAIQYKYVKWNGATAAWESNQSTSSGNREVTTCTSGSQSFNDGSFKS
ncbi:carbohydrate-binding module family 20 domain-containing protein [Silvimonas amylolytica]|uniref:Alpha-amylase n=1 Tax=Silvimonas amylolytica TaxID=449663 RepID=A0ABQ2PPQ7_9NEIS|nr:carbohydrate-binding module family 20 domain-containing protein [Silvimonas amylolytica]GGP27316.1 alpha-amylase [Silvimonas amylolytica]